MRPWQRVLSSGDLEVPSGSISDYPLAKALESLGLSGGGDDIAGPEFKALLDHAKSAEPGINDAILDEIVSSRLKNSYVYSIASVNRVSQLHFGRDLAI